MDPFTLQKKLIALYDKPIPKNKNFIKYNYTLEELKLALENEGTVFVVASLGGGNAYAVNKKLQTLRPLVNINLQALKLQSWESLKANTPIFIWKTKLYQLFSRQMHLTMAYVRERASNEPHNPAFSSFFATEIEEDWSACTFKR